MPDLASLLGTVGGAVLAVYLTSCTENGARERGGSGLARRRRIDCIERVASLASLL